MTIQTNANWKSWEALLYRHFDDINKGGNVQFGEIPEVIEVGTEKLDGFDQLEDQHYQGLLFKLFTGAKDQEYLNMKALIFY